MACPRVRIINKDGIAYLYDRVRAKFLSGRTQLSGYVDHFNCSNQIMNPRLAPESMIRSGTITSVELSDKGGDWFFEVYKNDSVTPLLRLSSVDRKNVDINIDFNLGDVLKFMCKGENIKYPRGSLEIAWRL